MKSVYERTRLIITEFDKEDVIATSAAPPVEPTTLKRELENAYGSFSHFSKAPGTWF